MARYKATIELFYEADDESAALGIADSIADYIDASYGNGMSNANDVETHVTEVKKICGNCSRIINEDEQRCERCKKL